MAGFWLPSHIGSARNTSGRLHTSLCLQRGSILSKHCTHTRGWNSSAPQWLLLVRIRNAKTAPKRAVLSDFGAVRSHCTRSVELLLCCLSVWIFLGKKTLFPIHGGTASASCFHKLHGFAGHWFPLRAERRAHCPCSSLTEDSSGEACCWSALPHKLTATKVKRFWTIRRSSSQPSEQAVSTRYKQTTNKIKTNNAQPSNQELEIFMWRNLEFYWNGEIQITMRRWLGSNWMVFLDGITLFPPWLVVPCPHHLAPSLLAP